MKLSNVEITLIRALIDIAGEHDESYEILLNASELSEEKFNKVYCNLYKKVKNV